MTTTLIPPQNIDAEESILGGILQDTEAMARVVDLITTEAFYVSAHRKIYDAALQLHLQDKPTDYITVTSWLKDHKQLDEIGGMAKISSLIDHTVSAVNIDRYAALVMDKFTRRQLIAIGHEIVNLGYDTTQELETIIDEVEQKVFQLNQKKTQDDLTPLSESLVETFTELEKLYQRNATPGITTEFYDIDAMTGGLQRSDLIIVAGRPSMGKTSFGLSMGLNIAKKHNLPIAIFSLEMSKQQLNQRWCATEAEIDSNRLRIGSLLPSELEPLNQVLANLSSLPVYVNDSPSITVSQMRTQVRRLQSKHKGELGAIIIDYLQLMGGDNDNRVQELAKISRGLKGLAREFNVPIIALSQLSRGVESRTNKRPMMSDLRDSGSIEQDADLIMMLYRDEYYNPDTQDRGVAEVNIVKHRNGPVGMRQLLFKPEYTKFFNIQRSNYGGDQNGF